MGQHDRLHAVADADLGRHPGDVGLDGRVAEGFAHPKRDLCASRVAGSSGGVAGSVARGKAAYAEGVTVAEDSATTLRSWAPIREADRRLQHEYVEFADDPANTHRETSAEQHLTASAFVFDAAIEQVLLCFHGKGRFWVQLGGHIEQSDASLADAALREALEESGLDSLTPVLATPVDLDRHALSSGFGTCRVHWDVGFAFIADPTAAAVGSDESDGVAWWPIDDLPDDSVTGLARRIDHALATIRGA